MMFSTSYDVTWFPIEHEEGVYTKIALSVELNHIQNDLPEVDFNID